MFLMNSDFFSPGCVLAPKVMWCLSYSGLLTGDRPLVGFPVDKKIASIWS